MARDHRRLAAIVSLDVAGYSRLMGVDDSGTLAALKAHRRELIDPQDHRTRRPHRQDDRRRPAAGVPERGRRRALIDRLIFRDWVEREADLARFAADARGFTEASSLATALVGAVDRFTAGAGATLYVRVGDGRFERRQSAAAGAAQTVAPQSLDADEPAAVALRAGRSVARCDEVHSSLPGELAVVLSRPRELDAFVLIGRRRDGSVLRADEVAALRAKLQSVGVEWQALRWEALQHERVHAHGPAS